MLMTRAQVVEEAKSWIGTPYHLHAMVKGAGVDCATLPWCIYRAAGFIPENDVLSERYSHDWFANTTEEKYLLHVMRYATKTAESIGWQTVKPNPGDLVLSRCVNSPRFNHAGIIVCWPYLIHGVNPEVEQACARSHRLWVMKQLVFFDPWARSEDKI